MKWPEDYINKIICSNCLEVMKEMPDNCIDTIITDPPYGIGFMGKEWDVFKSDFVRKSVEKSNRNTVKKDGMASKSAIRYDESLLGHQKYQDWCVEWMKECLRVSKPGATFLCCGSPRVYHHIALATERAGWIIKDCIMWLYGSGFPKASDISKQIDKKAGVKRNIVKKTQSGGYKRIMTTNKEHGFRPEDYYPEGNKFTSNEAITPEATLWNGWKSHGLKPAYEPILVAMKPNEGSYANNALKYGVAGLNIDGGRIGTDVNRGDRYGGKAPRGVKNPINITGKREKIWNVPKGRYPANVILDEEAGRLLDEQSGERKAGGIVKGNEPSRTGQTGIYGIWDRVANKPHNDTGGASRFFYCAKASKAERNRGCKGLEEKPAHDYGSIKKSEGRHGKNMPNSNYHPTVKPLALMKYLCTLTNTPTGGIVLDPFCGSGTTLMACKELKRNYIGIDNIPEYCEIARKRVSSISEPLF